MIDRPARRLWREFRSYDGRAIEWVKAGNIAITPGLLERIGQGASMYLHACDVEAFAFAALAIDCNPASVPPGRTGCNLDGEPLLRALVNCRIDSGFVTDPAGLWQPWKTERCPECGKPFHRVAAHMLTAGEVPLTSLECVAGHRWPL